MREKQKTEAKFTFFELIVISKHKHKSNFLFLSLLMHEILTLSTLIENLGIKDVRKLARKEEIEYGAGKMRHRIFRKIPCSGIFFWYSGQASAAKNAKILLFAISSRLSTHSPRLLDLDIGGFEPF